MSKDISQINKVTLDFDKVEEKDIIQFVESLENEGDDTGVIYRLKEAQDTNKVALLYNLIKIYGKYYNTTDQAYTNVSEFGLLKLGWKIYSIDVNEALWKL